MSNEFWSALSKKKREEILGTSDRGTVKSNEELESSDFWSALSPETRNEILTRGTTDYSSYKWRTSLDDEDDDIAPVFSEPSQTIETTQAIFDKYGKYYNLPDYDEYSKKGAGIANPTYDEANGLNLFGWRPFSEKVGNIVTFSRDNVEAIGMGEMQGANQVGRFIYRNMTDFEVGIYNYLLAKEGEDSAQKFLDDIEETLNAREGGAIAERIQNTGAVASTLLHGMASVGSGIESAGIGIRQLFSEEALPTTSSEFMSQALLEDLDGFEKELYQAGNTVGNMLPSIAVGAINPVAGRIVQSSSASGNAYRQALKEGKSKEEAAAYGVMIGGFEYATQKMLGGVAGMTGDIPSKVLSKIATFENALLRVGAKYAITTASEITEEEVQLWLEPFARKIAFGEDYDAPTLEEMAETAIVTAISTNILNTGTDIATGNLTKVNGLTQHEAKVIETEVKNRIAEQEKDGKKLSSKAKDKIYNDVVERMDKGQLNIDTIESVLGGETYETYKNLTEQENALQSKKKAIESEISDLVKTPESQFTIEQRERLTSLREEAKGIKEQIKALDTKTAKSNLFNEVNKLTAKDTYLRESYNESARRGQAFDADLTKYKGKQREAVERAIKSGVLNNTNRSHELVDTLSRLEADKGIVFDYANNEKLKKSGFAVEGKTVNGFVKDGVVTLNVQSSKAWQSTVGHEITHVLEGTESYGALREALYAYAESKGELASRKTALTELYNGMDADIDAELTADLVGDYLFTDKDFINKLTGNRTLFQKVWDEVKYLCKVATGKELTEIEKVEREFAKAWKETKNTANNSGVKYSITEAFTDNNGNRFENAVLLDTDFFDGISPRNWGEKLREKISERASDNPFILPIVDEIGNTTILQFANPNDRVTKNGKSEHKVIDKLSSSSDNISKLAVIHIDEIVSVSDENLPYFTSENDHQWLDKNGWLHRNANVINQKNGNIYNLTLDIAKTADGRTILYATDGKIKKVGSVQVNSLKIKGSGQDSNFSNSVPQSEENVNTKFSVSPEIDTNYMSAVERGDTETAQKMVDEAAKNAGYDIKAYHGTGYDFTVFDKSKQGDNYHDWGRLGKGFYFAPTSREAETWAELSKGGKNKVMPVYLRSENMLDSFEALPDDLKDTIPADWEGLTRRLAEKYAYNYIEYMQEFGYNVQQILTEKGYDGINGHTEFVVFDPEQVKSADTVTKDDNGNVIPLSQRFNTSNPDIRFSLSKSVEETKDLVAIHNLQSSELVKTLELGGLPMPSIAVLKAEQSHEQYGDVSLIFSKETIDPEVSSANKVYGGDAWTPTYPKIEYKPNEAVAQKIGDKYYDLAKRIGYDEVRPMYRYANELEDALNRDGGETSMLEKLYDDTGMMNLYLQDSGKGKIEPITKENVTKISDAEAEMNQYFINALGQDFVASFKAPDGVNGLKYRTEFLEQHEEKIREAYKRYFVDEHGFTTEEVENVFENITRRDLMKLMRDAYMYTQNNGVTVRTETDHTATENAIRESASDGYKEWIDGLFKGIEEKSGIRNNQEYFTRSGNRRSWDALHWENTLENVVKVMKEQEDTGVGSFSPFNTLFGASHKRYDSIQDIKADSDRLRKINQDEYDNIKDSFSERFAEIATSIKDPDERNSFIATDTAAEQIIEAIRTKKTKTGILNHLRALNSRATMQTVDDVLALVSDIANMPTGYFEAKPKRAVGLEEVGVFVIPNNVDVKLKQELLNKGYSIAEYDPNVEGDRQRVVNQFEEYKFSLSDVGEQFAPVGNYSTPLNETALDIAPVAEDVAENAITTDDNIVPVVAEEDMFPSEISPIDEIAQRREFFDGIREEDIPPEAEAPYYGEEAEPANPFENRDIKDVGNQKVKAYMYENPEVKPFFQQEARVMLGELDNTVKGERWYNDSAYDYGYGADVPKVFGTSRHTSDDIAYLLDELHYSYDQIRKGLNAIIEDDGRENNAVSKRIEFLLNDRLLNGYQDMLDGYEYPPNQDYINLLNEKQITEYNEEAFKRFMETPSYLDDIAPVLENIPVLPDEELEQGTYAAIRPEPTKQPSLKKVNNAESKGHIAQVLTEEPKVEKKKKGIISTAIANFVDKGAVFESLSLKTKNRALQDTYKAIGRSETKAQYFMENGTEKVKSLDAIRAEVEKTGKVQDFYNYIYHKHNIDRMNLESKERSNLERLSGEMNELKLLHLQENQLRAIASEKITKETAPKRAKLIKTVQEYLASKDVKNKPVFDYSVTSKMSQDIVTEYEAKNPDFKEYAQDVYDYMNHLRKMMVYNGIISPETAELWAEMYPHYVPIRRVDHEGLAVNVPLDTNKTGINAPIKRATGGNSDILPLFTTMAQRTTQTFKAISKNRFGIELKDTLGGVTESTKTNLDEVIDSIDAQDGLLQEGKNGKNPTFTVFEGGDRITFDITEEMYDALKPTSEGLSYTNKALNTASNLHRGVLTEYSVPFMVTNSIKDAQDVLINSQHPAKTYAKFPTAISELFKKGKWYTEYMENGGGDNTYFDKQTNTFNKEKSQLRKIIGFPLDKISDANNFIEKVPRLAEYIASRESGASVDAAMLDAARVTTDFSAGGDVTKFLNRNGATFLNASVQGFTQQVRNVREAKMNGLKGWLGLATKYAIAGLPALLLNGALWDDDEEYEELSDYVKENYYIVGKYGDGKFVRIPKGRALAVIQNGFEQVSNALTGNDEVDFGRFFELFVSNLAPNNPLDNNIIAPIKQVMENKTWYGEDLVPSRLQDLPAAEQYDESTDSISKWLGESFNVSPYKINYVLNQYSGGVGDVFLPMLTPEAESGDNSFGGNLIAPLKDKFTTDSVMNNQNVSDFYDAVDVLTKNAKSSYATEEDILKSKYINSVSTELGDLYKSKREIQNSNLSDGVKYNQVRNIQEQINNLAKKALDSYENVNVQGGYATVGNKHYRLDDGVWTKISDKQLERQQQVTSELGISPSEYWSKTNISYFPNSDGEYEYAYDNPEKYSVSKVVGGYDTYKTYSKDLYNIKADKDENGKSINGSRKQKVLDYINNLDADYETKIILWKSEYPPDDTYNMDIINYINNRTDLTYDERVAIFTELGFTVSGGSVYWD